MRCNDIEVYLSGYLDKELTADRKREVEAHLAECASCRKILRDLKEVRQGTRDLKYQEPSSQEWQRMERSIFIAISRGLGWVVLSVWSVVTVAYACYEYFSAPAEPIFQKILVFALLVGLGLLFLSVLSERIRDSRTDRYKGVRQ